MNAKKALKKLKKKTEKKLKGTAIKKLASIKINTKISQPQIFKKNTLSSELKNVTNQAMISAVSELAAPLNPILSWLNGGDFIDLTRGEKTENKLDLNTHTNDSSTPPQIKSIVHLPMKSPPCKRCPALSGGICKCAAKKFKMSA